MITYNNVSTQPINLYIFDKNNKQLSDKRKLALIKKIENNLLDDIIFNLNKNWEWLYSLEEICNNIKWFY